MANRLPSGKWRGRVSVTDPATGKSRQIAPHKVIGGPTTYPTQRAAERAEDQARDQLLGKAQIGMTLREWFEIWSTDPNWQRPSESTNVHNRERCSKFVGHTVTVQSARSAPVRCPSG